MTTVNSGITAVLIRAQRGIAALASQLEPLGFPAVVAAVSLLLMLLACGSEWYSMTVALSAQFPQLSDGVDLGHQMMSMRVGIIAALILGHALISHKPGHGVGLWRRLLGRFRVLPMVAIIGGMAVFMFTAASSVTGDGGTGGLAGIGLGVVCGGLFTVSFLASNTLAGILMPAVRTLVIGLGRRAAVAKLSREVNVAGARAARIVTLKREIEAKEKPGFLEGRAAAEAAARVGGVAAQIADLESSLSAVPSDLREGDVVDMPDAAPAALKKRLSELEKLDVKFFLNLLKKSEA